MVKYIQEFIKKGSFYNENNEYKLLLFINNKLNHFNFNNIEVIKHGDVNVQNFYTVSIDSERFMLSVDDFYSSFIYSDVEDIKVNEILRKPSSLIEDIYNLKRNISRAKENAKKLAESHGIEYQDTSCTTIQLKAITGIRVGDCMYMDYYGAVMKGEVTQIQSYHSSIPSVIITNDDESKSRHVSISCSGLGRTKEECVQRMVISLNNDINYYTEMIHDRIERFRNQVMNMKLLIDICKKR